MKLFKSLAIRAVALLLFFTMIAAVILYQAGVYDLSFIDRPLPPMTEGAETTAPSTEGESSLPPPPPTTSTSTLQSDPIVIFPFSANVNTGSLPTIASVAPAAVTSP